MHETAIAQSIIKTVLEQADHQDAIQVTSVEIEVGEFAFLNTEQVKFWLTIGFENTIAKEAKLIFSRGRGVIFCKDCRHKGKIKTKSRSDHKMIFPLFFCPKCRSSQIEILQGRESFIRKIQIRKSEKV
jgi:hydrogenase nickel insertion protein HypA